MKHSLISHLALVLGTFTLLCSCDKEAAKGKSPTDSTAVVAEDPRFSPWSSKAELQFKMERLPADQFFSAVQGRCYNGINQYRAITEKFQQEKYREWAVFWGLTEKELFDYEITLLRLGFERHQTQVFTDSSGVALHQLIMLCPLNAESFEEPGLTVLEKNQIDPAILAQAPASANQDLGKPVDPQGGVVSPQPVKPMVMETLPEGPAVAQQKETLVAPLPEETPEEEMEPTKPEVVAEVKEPTAPKAVPVVEEKPVATGKMRNHIVVKGDTLSSISRRYRVSVAAIKSANQLKSDFLRLKQLLKIPTK